MKIKYNLVGSSNVIFTHSYGRGLKDVDALTGYIDIGYSSIDYPSYLDNIHKVKLYNENSNNLIKFIKSVLKFTGLDKTRAVTYFLNRKDELQVNNRIINKINDFKSKTKSNNFIFVWSTSVKKELAAIKRCYAKELGSLALVVNTYPIRGNLLITDGSNEEIIKDRDFFHNFKKIIVTSSIMKDFFIRHELATDKQIIISPDYLPFSAYVEKGENIVNGQIKAIYLGNVNFNERTIDDVTETLDELIDLGVEVWIQEPKCRKHINDNMKYFKPFTYEEMLNGQLGAFVSQFDFCIVAYNGINNARTNMGFPTRYALSMTGGIPIAIKANTYLAIEEQFSGWNICYEKISDVVGMIDEFKLQRGNDFKNKYVKLIEELVN